MGLTFFFNYLFLAVLGLYCCAQAFLVATSRLLITVAFLVVKHRLQGEWASGAVTHGLSRPEACGIFGTRNRTCVPAPAGRFLTTGLPGKSLQKCFNFVFSSSESGMLRYCGF